jgi:cold shock CspA family protein
MRGRMLWFNEKKDLGFIRTDDDERLSVRGPAFADGKRPRGRCAERVVSFEITEADGEREAENVVFIDDDAPRRARMRHRPIRTGN